MAQDDGRRVFNIDSEVVRIDGFFSIIERAKKERLLDSSTPINYLRFSGVIPPERADYAEFYCGQK